MDKLHRNAKYDHFKGYGHYKGFYKLRCSDTINFGFVNITMYQKRKSQ